MAGPWERYASAPAPQTDAGPWMKYSGPEAAPAQDKYIAPHNIIMGGLKGAADIGTTLLRPVDALLNVTGISDRTNKDRRATVQQFFNEQADPNSLAFKGGELAADIAGTAGIGGVLGKGAKMLNASPAVVSALQSGGFRLGAGAPASAAGRMALRTGAGAAGGYTAAGLINPDDAAAGGFIGAALPLGVKAAGRAGSAIRSAFTTNAEKLMQSALKPTMEQLRSGDAAIAVRTLLDNGISPNAAGVEKLQGMINGINDQIDDLIKGSTAKIDRDKVTKALLSVRGKFATQVNPQSDLDAIAKVAENFKNHPTLANLNAEELKLVDAIHRAQAARVSALQDAGRFETMAAQQRTLSQSQPISLSTRQPTNQPYFNVGSLGGEAASPLAPSRTGGTVMPPPRYTSNIQRVPEAQLAAEEARKIAAQRASEKVAAEKALADYMASGGSGIPVELAQEMKKGTYRVLANKYGEIGSATTEAEKALARGLKEGIAEAIPQISGLNAKESALIKTLDVAERRALMDLNKNPFGLSLLAGNKAAWGAFMADRSAAFKSLAARMVNRAGQSVETPTNKLSELLANPAARNALIQYESR